MIISTGTVMDRWVIKGIPPHHFLSTISYKWESLHFILKKVESPMKHKWLMFQFIYSHCAISYFCVNSFCINGWKNVKQFCLCLMNESEIQINLNHGANYKVFSSLCPPSWHCDLILNELVFQIRTDKKKASQLTYFTLYFIFYCIFAFNSQRSHFSDSNIYNSLSFCFDIFSTEFCHHHLLFNFSHTTADFSYCCNQYGQIHSVHIIILTIYLLSFVLLMSVMYEFFPRKT